MIDNSEHEELLEILEEMDDQEKAVVLLKELNDLSSRLGLMIMNTDKNVDNEQWKSNCDIVKKQLDDVIAKIRENGN